MKPGQDWLYELETEVDDRWEPFKTQLTKKQGGYVTIGHPRTTVREQREKGNQHPFRLVRVQCGERRIEETYDQEGRHTKAIASEFLTMAAEDSDRDIENVSSIVARVRASRYAWSA
jgi:hypothetical protein